MQSIVCELCREFLEILPPLYCARSLLYAYSPLCTLVSSMSLCLSTRHMKSAISDKYQPILPVIVFMESCIHVCMYVHVHIKCFNVMAAIWGKIIGRMKNITHRIYTHLEEEYTSLQDNSI